MILPVVTREINALEDATIRLFEIKAFKDSRVGWLLLSGISALQRDDEKLQVLRKQFKAQSESWQACYSQVRPWLGKP